jgi:hypothetical protein
LWSSSGCSTRSTRGVFDLGLGRSGQRRKEAPRATGADELLVTTVTYDHADRVHSYELLAKERRG